MALSQPTTVGQAWSSCDHVIEQEPCATHKKQKLTLDHPDDLDNEDALMLFDGIAAVAKPGKDNQPILISFVLEKNRVYLALKDCLRMLLCSILLGAVSFGFAALYFSQMLQVDTDPALPDDDAAAFWQSCSDNASVTALGCEFPYNTARAQVSVPKFVEIAVMGTILVQLMTQQHRQMLTGCMLFSIATAASLVYVLADILDMDPLPLLLDPLISFSMVLVITARLCWNFIRARKHAINIVRLYPRLCFALGFVAIFALNAVLVNFTADLERLGLHPVVVVVIWLVAIRIFGMVARWIFCGIHLPLVASFAVFFVCDTSNLMALRRYMLIVDGFEKAVLLAAISAVLEFFSNVFSILFCVYVSNLLLSSMRQEAAAVHIHFFFTSVISELLAEHVALHGVFGASIFMNHHTTTLQVPIKATAVIANWSISFVMEILVDLVSIFLIGSLLPVSLPILFGNTRQPVIFAIFILAACIHPFLIGLHIHVDKELYFC